MQRTGTVDDLAAMGHFLLTDKSSWLEQSVNLSEQDFLLAERSRFVVVRCHS